MDPATLEGQIIREIRKADEISRRDLADHLGVARSTAGRRVDNLIERGLLRESGIEERAGVGRPKRFLALRGSYGAFAGFDFDARHLFAALVDFSQNTLEEKQVAFSSPPTRENVLAVLRETIQEFSWHGSATPILGYGFGIPGRVQQDSGIALDYPYIKNWEQVDIASELNLSSARVHIENNTRTIALGEYWLGSDHPSEDLVCLSVRTGISAAVISSGQLLRGRHEMAGEIRGWQILNAAPDAGESGWLETQATVRSITDNDSVASPRTWNRFVKACLAEEPDSLSVLVKITGIHADAIARLVQLADPERVVLSGAFRDLGSPYLERLREETAKRLAGHYFSPPPIDFVCRGDYTGAHGAAALAAQNFRQEA